MDAEGSCDVAIGEPVPEKVELRRRVDEVVVVVVLEPFEREGFPPHFKSEEVLNG